MVFDRINSKLKEALSWLNKRREKAVEDSGFTLEREKDLFDKIPDHRKEEFKSIWQHFLVATNQKFKEGKKIFLQEIIKMAEKNSGFRISDSMNTIIEQNSLFYSKKIPFTIINFDSPNKSNQRTNHVDKQHSVFTSNEATEATEAIEKITVENNESNNGSVTNTELPTKNTGKKVKTRQEEIKEKYPDLYALQETYGLLVQVGYEKNVFIDSENKVVTHLVSKKPARFTGYKHLYDARALVEELYDYSEITDLPFPRIKNDEYITLENGDQYYMYQEEMAQGHRLSDYLNSGKKFLSNEHVNIAVTELQKLHQLLGRAHGDLKPENIYLQIDNNQDGSIGIKVTYIDLASPKISNIRDKERMTTELERIKVLFSMISS